jgi:hypothetical protein
VARFGFYRWLLLPVEAVTVPDPTHRLFDLIGEPHGMIMDATVHVAFDAIRGPIAHRSRFRPRLPDRCKVILHDRQRSTSLRRQERNRRLITIKAADRALMQTSDFGFFRFPI